MMNELKFDLHIHSIYSGDGVLDPQEIVTIARKKGLDGIAITDHNTIEGGESAGRYATGDLIIITGAEIMTEKGEITGLFLQEEITSRRFFDVIEEIKDQGGMIIVPHPFDRMRSTAFSITPDYINLIDAIEAFNSRCVFNSYNVKARDFAATHGLSVTGGSDAHFANEIGIAGIITKSRDVRKAIENNDLRLFGKRSSVFNHVRTKIRKLR